MHTTIGHEDLDRVTGGTTTTTAPASTSRCGTTSDALLSTLNSLSTSLTNLNNPNNNNSLNTTTMLCLAMCMSQRHGTSGYVGRGGYYYSYW